MLSCEDFTMGAKCFSNIWEMHCKMERLWTWHPATNDLVSRLQNTLRLLTGADAASSLHGPAV